MVMTTRPMQTLTAAEVMSRTVAAIPEEMPLREAARLLEREQISGAPVVDHNGRCVGVLSAMDFVHWAVKEGKPPAPGGHWEAGRVCSEWQIVDPEALPRDEVRRFMSPDLVTAEPTTPIADLARRMLDAHIHRIIVVDPHRRPVGIVSSTDILAVVAHG
ncbi:MAG: CBS domain-containing protein [Gemmataceae bacterium]|nr:CBS domain-containing protein [Gemmataceae bacterium]